MKGKLWPYILPLPPTEQYSLLSSVFGSKISVRILQLTTPGARTYQKDLIDKLSEYSNKTVIEKLKRLVASGVLEEGMEKKKVSRSKMGWVKWYEPTFLGKWICLLLRPPKDVPQEEAEKILMELLTLYACNAVELCATYNIDPKLLEKALQDALLTSRKSSKSSA